MRSASATDGKGQVSRYTYDGFGRTTQVLYGRAVTCTNAACITYTYDGDGNPLTQTDGGGTISYRYDTLGRQAARRCPARPSRSSPTTRPAT